MAYTSCKYGPPAQPELMIPQMIICTDDQDQEWQLTEDSQVGDWLRFVEDGGEVTPYQPPPETKPAE